MLATEKPLTALTAEDVMCREVKTIPHDLPLREAARIACPRSRSAAPRWSTARAVASACLSATDLSAGLREEGRDTEDGPVPVCPYQVKGRLLTGEDAVICTQPEGRCPLQDIRATPGGRHTAVCRQPNGVLCDWQQVAEQMPVSPVRRYMTADVVTAAPTATVPELARRMLDAHIHRIIVVDEQHRPIGIVSSTDILAAVAYSAAEEADSCSPVGGPPLIRKRAGT